MKADAMFASALVVPISPLLSVQAKVVAPPRLSPDQAVVVARQFCQQIDAPVHEAGVARYPSPDHHGHWMPRWQVEFRAEAIVEIVDRTGMIASYFHFSRVRWAADDRPAGPGMPEAAAIRRAEAVVTATRCNEPLRFKKAVEGQTVFPPVASGHDWYVTWERMYRGIPFKEPQAADVCLNAESGDVVYVNNRFLTPPPAAAIVKLTQEQAGAVASGVVATSGRLGEIVSAREEIVQPNGVWRGGTDGDEEAFSRVAWTFGFQTDRREACQVWVDAENGGVIGGYAAPIIGAPKPAPGK